MTFLIYLIGIVDGLREFMVFIIIVALLPLLLTSILVYVYEVMDSDYISKEFVRILPSPKTLILIMLTISSVRVFVPDSNTIAAMAIVPPVVEAVTENEEVRKLPNNVLKFLNNYLEEHTSVDKL